MHINKPQPVKPPLSLQEIGKLLVEHYELKEGKYELLLEFSIGMGNVGPTPETRVPGAMVGVSKIGLVKTEKDGPLTINAAELQ
ncbi:MAG: hypothetical protein U9P10_11790 [Thermodesulfobacteriota bacterium]|nr:hypothetical protein [Thermodesulfobacteriota bacterium]